MLKVDYASFFISVLHLALLTVDAVEETTETEYEIINKEELQKRRNATTKEVNSDSEEEDIYDDYMKILIFQGAEFRAAIRNEDKLWEDGEVPYEILKDYKSEDKTFILNAMEEFHNRTCIRFRERKDERSYISIVPGSGCSAVLGNATQENKVTLGENCLVKGIVLHELMHALGFTHEQNRPDRDQFVKIVFDNIKEGAEKNFEKLSADKIQTLSQTYDYGSVMHYGAFDFAKNRSKETVVVLRNGTEIGQRIGFSDSDVLKINLLYNCKNETSENATEKLQDEKIVETEAEDEKRSKRRRNRFYRIFAKFVG